MQIEHVAGIGFTSGGTTQDQRNLTIGHSLFRQVVVDHECGQATVAEVLADGSASKRCIVLHGGRVSSGGSHDDGVRHGPVLLECRHESGHGRGLLANGHINTVDRLACLIETLLVDDGIHGDGGLTRLTVADDEFALSAADGDHRVDGLQTGLQRLLHGLTVDHTGGLTVERHLEGVAQVDVTLAVDSLSQRIDDAAQHVVVDAD